MKKKFCLAALAALALSSMCLFVFAACENEHNHTYSEEWSYSDTEHWRVCTDDDCDATTDRAKHDWKAETLTRATCTEKGAVRYTCRTCGAAKEEETDALGHALKNGECSHCGEKVTDILNGTYGYDFLGTLPNGEGMQALYEDIDAAVTAFHIDTDRDAPGDLILAAFDYTEYGLTDKESIAVWKTYKDDNPLYYWLSNSLTVVYETRIELLIEEDYASAETRANYNVLIDDTINEYATNIDAGATVYDTALACHDFILRAVDYAKDADIDKPWAHNILGVLENRSAVCEGYARTYQLMLNFAGVENLFVTGEGDGEEHAWNLVKLDDGQWYWCDLTYDDAPGWKWGITYNYFCNMDEDFLPDHTFDTSSGEGIYFQYDLPDRATSDYADEGLQIGEEFIVDACAYEIVGYNAVALRRTDIAGIFAIPETVQHDGRDYTVIALGSEETISGQINCLDGSIQRLITSVSIPKTVEFIGNRAFGYMPLENISVDDENLYFTAKDGVLFTKTLFTLIQYPNKHERTEYIIPDQTEIIAREAFYECSYLEKVTFGENVSTLNFENLGGGFPDESEGGYLVGSGIMDLYEALTGKKEIVFNDNYFIDEVGVYNASKTRLYYILDKTITEYCVPASLQTIGSNTTATGPFTDCYSLEKFTVEEGNQWFAAQDGVLYNRAMTQIKCIPAALKGEITIPEGVTAIGMESGIGIVFSGCSGLTKINLPSSLKIIGTNAFEGCTNLQSIEIPDCVTLIGVSAFRNCTGLKKIVLPESVATIKDSAFCGCANLTSLTIPANVSFIAGSIIDKCRNLSEVYFADPEGWTADGEPIDAELLRDPETAAELLKNTYLDADWKKN